MNSHEAKVLYKRDIYKIISKLYVKRDLTAINESMNQTQTICDEH